MKPMNKKGLALAAVVLLLAAALFVGAGAGEIGPLEDGTGTEVTNAPASDDAQNANTDYTLIVKETPDTEKGEFSTISAALATVQKSATGSATIEIYGTIVEPNGVISNAQEGWNYTFVGKDADAEIDLSAKTDAGSHIDTGVSSLKFENLTLTFDSGAPYRGFQHTGHEEYSGCTINGFFKTYAPEVIFNGCTFNQTTYEYHLWVYGESTTTFTGCEFDDLGKAVKIYREGNQLLNVTFTGCTFKAHDIPEGKGKAAIEINSDYMEAKVTIAGCTVEGFVPGSVSKNNVWNNEPDNTGDASQKATVYFPVHFDAGAGVEQPKDIVIAFDATSNKTQVKNETKYGTLPTPTKAGASFDGWYTAATGGELVTAATVIKPEDAVEHTLYAHWSAPVAKIGTTTYGSLAEAVADVPAGKETTITMIADHTIIGNTGVTIPADREIILDLNGHTVQNVVGEEKASQIIDNQGTLTIKDSTDKKKDGTGKGKLMNVVEDGIQPGDWDQWNYATNVILNQGILTVESGLLEQTAGGTICYAIDAQTNGTLYTVSTTIKGGNMTSVKTAVRMFCNSATNANNMVVEGGTITSKEKYGLVFQSANTNANKGSLTVKGGTVNGGVVSGTEYESLNVWADTGSDTKNMSVNITGGVFTTKVTIDKVAPETLSVSGGHFKQITVDSTPAKKKFITGGIFDTKPDDKYIAAGYQWDEDAKAVAKVQPVEKETFTPSGDAAKVPGAPEGTKIKEISDIPTAGSLVITQVTYSASTADPAEKVTAVKETLVSIDVSVYVGDGEGAKTKYTENLGKLVTVKFTIPDNNYNLNELAVYHERSSDHVWEKLNFVNNTPKKVGDGTIEIAVQTTSFSPFTVVQLAPKSSSSSSQGSSTWLTEPTAQPTPTPTATPVPVETPGVKPVTPTGTPAKTPAPVAGILAGLGCAAVLFGMRRK